MTTYIDTNIENAINDSIRDEQTVDVEVRLDSEDWVRWCEGLSARGGTYAERREAELLVRDYTGTDTDGDRWAISVSAY